MREATIAVITDLHAGPPEVPPVGARRSDLVLSLLDEVVGRLNGSLHPDIVVILGDLVEAGSSPGAPLLYDRIAEAVRRIEAPAIVLPGNHDGSSFYDSFPRREIVELHGMRFVSFVDPEEPGWNARRDASGFSLMRRALCGEPLPVVALQHVPVFPSGTTDSPYGYVDADEVIGSMREQGIRLALCGHYHAGFDLVHADGLCFLATPALCEAPFRFDLVRTDGERTSVEHHALSP